MEQLVNKCCPLKKTHVHINYNGDVGCMCAAQMTSKKIPHCDSSTTGRAFMLRGDEEVTSVAEGVKQKK